MSCPAEHSGRPAAARLLNRRPACVAGEDSRWTLPPAVRLALEALSHVPVTAPAQSFRAAVPMFPAAAPAVAAAVDGRMEWVGDARFAACRALTACEFEWSEPARELVTGCYILAGERARFRLAAGEYRFFLLNEG